MKVSFMNIQEAINLFTQDLYNLDADTLKAYKLDLEKFSLYLNDYYSKQYFDLQKINNELIKKYLDNLTTNYGKRVSVSTQNRHYATLRRFFTFLYKKNYIKEQIFNNIQRRKANKDLGEIPSGSIIKSIDQVTINKILKKCSDLRTLTLFLMVYSTGVRISEALALKVSDLQGDTVILRSTKGNKPRQTYLSKNLKPVLKKYLITLENKSSWLFPGETEDQPLSYSRARQLFQKITKNLTNPDSSAITIHQLRHTFATERVGQIDSILLMNLMGHSDIRTTLRYAKVMNKASKSAFEQFDRQQDYLVDNLNI